MPWSIADVESHRKGLTPSQKQRWVGIANRVLLQLRSKGNANADAIAIRTANAYFQEQLRFQQHKTGAYGRLDIMPLVEEAGITAIVGRRTDATKVMQIQSIVFDPDRWTMREAKNWITENRQLIERWSGMGLNVGERDLREDVHRFTKPTQIDRVKGIIEGVKILGKESVNGNSYTDAALNGAVALYEGVKVNLNHPKGSATSPRFIEERFGKFVKARREPDGLYADLHYNPKHPMAECVAWFAENMSDAIGPSHNAVGKGRPQGGKFLVESIARVHHVDLVADPATTKGLFEEKQGGGESSSTGGGVSGSSIAELLEVIKKTIEPEKGEEGERARETPAPKTDDKATTEGVVDMDWTDITLDGLRTNRKDLVESILTEQKSSEEQKALLEERKTLKAENDALKVEKALGEKRKKVATLVETAKLPKEAVTETFLEQLVSAPDDATLTKLLEDRKVLALASKPKSRGNDTGFAGQVTDAKTFAAAVR